MFITAEYDMMRYNKMCKYLMVTLKVTSFRLSVMDIARTEN